MTALRTRPATVIIADKNMPGMDGLAFLSAVRGDGALGAPKIIMLSGDASAAHAAAACGRRRYGSGQACAAERPARGDQ
ncbi:MAG: hypothetical protein IPG56_17025 [Caulobacteraceae bacterium]|nr:hypothetical protein [Caulobacteraceae bacterium]